ncbi:TPA: IS200/IS605 family accessory protein TnpB-related protein [Providencia alcalifaciens]
MKLAVVHERVANARGDFQHKLSRSIVDENQAVIVETLKSSNMMKNHSLSCAIGDAGWNGFITKLEYKAAEKGVHRVKLAQWFASSKNLPFLWTQNVRNAIYGRPALCKL